MLCGVCLRQAKSCRKGCSIKSAGSDFRPLIPVGQTLPRKCGSERQQAPESQRESGETNLIVAVHSEGEAMVFFKSPELEPR